MSTPPTELPHWYCLRTQVKREHIAAQHLRAIEGVEVFCPRLKYRKPTRRGRIWWVEALFPGYVLARFPLRTLERQIRHAQGVSGIVHFGTEVPSVPETAVRDLQREIRQQQLDGGETIEAAPQIETGDEVTIADGPLQGMSGTVLEILPSADRVKVLLEFLGRQHAVDIDLFSLLLPKKPTMNRERT
ncbi:MAG TPA: transcription termination/antitermination NusG family protein [Luteolibacter sp.]|nr:transcription termination/antitermination NusG family protein [Luteolibacter sp.]